MTPSFKRGIHQAVTALRGEERRIRAQLEIVQAQIAKLNEVLGLNKSRTSKGRERLSNEGREAISRAAKKKWQEYRAQKGRSAST